MYVYAAQWTLKTAQTHKQSIETPMTDEFEWMEK